MGLTVIICCTRRISSHDLKKLLGGYPSLEVHVLYSGVPCEPWPRTIYLRLPSTALICFLWIGVSFSPRLTEFHTTQLPLRRCMISLRWELLYTYIVNLPMGDLRAEFTG